VAGATRQAQASVRIAAPPERVFALVADLPRMGEWSPECRRSAWVDGADGPALGARVKGWNRRGLVRWATVSRVDVYEPGRLIGWEVLYPVRGPHTRWRYEVVPADGGTELRESFELLHEPVELKVFRVFAFGGTPRRVEQLKEGMRATLERIKAVAEQG
jgi:uncharacterized protein YndB with AHSA1/START domain